MAVETAVNHQQRSSFMWPGPPPEPPPTFDWRLLLYNLALVLAAPALAAYVLWRIVVRSKSRTGWNERLGFVPQAARHRPRAPSIWLHAVSVGEVAVASCLLDGIKRHIPGARVVVTTTTPTGQSVARSSCRDADAIFYFPFDFLPAVERALRAVRPDLVILMEGELWPNFLSAARRRGVSTMVVNGRVSERTYRRLRVLDAMFAWVIRRVDRYCAQSKTDAERIITLGAEPGRVANLGNVKFDQLIPRVPADERGRLGHELGVADAQTVIVAGSTHPSEEKIVLDAFHTVRQVDPAARLIIAPRHIERAEEVGNTVAQAGLRSRRRTQGQPPAAEGPNTVVILDTLGELRKVYAIATIAFVGGSFVTIGGHNVLEATSQGVPCVVGPHMHNFRDIASIITEAGIGFQAQTPEQLGAIMARLLKDRAHLQEIDRQCESVLALHRGAAARCVAAASEMLSYRAPQAQMGVAAGLRAFLVGALSGADTSAGARALIALLAPLSALYWLGLKVNRLMYRLRLARVTRLPVPVVSVGNLTAGGTGKTSAAALLAAEAVRRGRRPAILSRGYGGAARATGVAVVSDQGRLVAEPAQSGDEPHLLARKVPGATVLVGKDRRETGRRAIAEHGANLLILDDGFQYWRLAKDREIVLVDALAPFGTGLVLPAGILREPASHLRRADAVWITHADLVSEERVAAVRERVRRFFAGPVVDTVHRPIELRSLNAGTTLDLGELKGKVVAALSGIGNPLAFELTMARLGARVLPVRFPDHHPYTPEDCLAVERFAKRRGAMIITTEKDAVRMDAGAFTVPVVVLVVELAPTRSGGLASELEAVA
jgi:3-deoxy-D-manno-octulosonic-acid transferase